MGVHLVWEDKRYCGYSPDQQWSKQAVEVSLAEAFKAGNNGLKGRYVTLRKQQSRLIC